MRIVWGKRGQSLDDGPILNKCQYISMKFCVSGQILRNSVKALNCKDYEQPHFHPEKLILSHLIPQVITPLSQVCDRLLMIIALRLSVKTLVQIGRSEAFGRFRGKLVFEKNGSSIISSGCPHPQTVLTGLE